MVRWLKKWAPKPVVRPLRGGPVTPEQVDRDAGGDLYLRHLLFLRFVLNERLTDAAPMARMAANAGWPLTVEAMHHVADHWHEAEHECDDCPEMAEARDVVS